MMDHYRKLENMYLAAPINELYLPIIEVAEETCKITIDVNPQFFHAADALHGSVYFKMLDDAAFFAANSLVPDVFVLTGKFEVKLLRPVTEGKLIASGRVTNQDEKIQASAELRDATGNLLAIGKGIFVKSNKALAQINSYNIL